MNDSDMGRHFSIKPLREHLRAHKAVPSLGHSFLYSIDFIHEFHLQIINFV